MSWGLGLGWVPFPLVTRQFRKNTRQKWPPSHSCLLSCSLPLPECWENKTQLYPLGFEIHVWLKNISICYFFLWKKVELGWCFPWLINKVIISSEPTYINIYCLHYTGCLVYIFEQQTKNLVCVPIPRQCASQNKENTSLVAWKGVSLGLATDKQLRK